LTSFKAKTKEEAARKLMLIKNDIVSKASKLNQAKTLPLLLCLEDAINNLEIGLAKKHHAQREFDGSPELLMAAVHFVNEWYTIINEIVDVIYANGFYDSSTKIEICKIGFGLVFNDDLESFLDELRKKGEIKSQSIIVQKPRLFMNRQLGHYFLDLEPGYSKHCKKNLEQILVLRDLIYQKGLLETMIYALPIGAEVEFDDTGLRKITYPPYATYESILEKVGITPEVLENAAKVFDWNSYFRKIAVENLKSGENKGKSNIEHLRRENEQIFRAYDSLPSFKEAFCALYNINMKIFFEIVQEVMLLCYSNLHTVGIWKSTDLLDKCQQKFKFDDFMKTLELLTNSEKKWGRHLGLVHFGENILTNFRRLSVSELSLLENCFNEFYENDFKGMAFERACRKLLRENHLRTVPGRIDVFESMLPPDIANMLWGKQKNRTDVDVFANLDNNILLVECKEIKSSIPQLHEQNLFKKYVVELAYKAKWISQNLGRFSRYVGVDAWKSLLIEEDRPIHIFPIVVSNQYVRIDDLRKAPLVTYLELKKMLAANWKVESEEKAGSLEVDLGIRKIDLFWVA
jgi:hypothetical protein